MNKKHENIHPDQWIKDLPPQTSPAAFDPEEMLNCPKCDRKTPPTRTACFYCGADLPVSELHAKYLKLNLRKLEPWEKGFNLILVPGEMIDQTKLHDIARHLDRDHDELVKFLNAKKSLPLARIESQKDAEVLQGRLADCGVGSAIISDESLKLASVARRLRGIEFLEGTMIFILFNNDEIIEIGADQIALIVTGALFERRIEATTSLKRKETSKILDSSETSSDELLLDLYTSNDSLGYRVELKGFDFSCLGPEKGLLAKDNMVKLVAKFCAAAPRARFVFDYLQVRAELSRVWVANEKVDSGGIGRKGMGAYQRTNTTTISNLEQFNRYSRLQWNLI